MQIINIPESYKRSAEQSSELFIYDFKMTQDVLKSKVNLTLHMFSFLQTGEKKVHFEDAFVEVNNSQSVLLKAGNCLMTELLNNEQIYFCKLFFFSNKNVEDFLGKHNHFVRKAPEVIVDTPFFLIENDEFINSFVTSISAILKIESEATPSLLAIKFEEIMLYLTHKYGSSFLDYIQSLASDKSDSSFRKIVEANVLSNLSLSEIAFLANMSLSTFKRHFEKEYQAKPGKWLQQKRLSEAKMLLEKGTHKSSEIFSNFGYNNLSNFSAAYKKAFGHSPTGDKK